MSGPRSARVIVLGEAERLALQALTRQTTAAAGLVRRARIILLAAEGRPLDQIARGVGADRSRVRAWVDRYRADGLVGLYDRPRPGRPRSFSP